MAAIIRPRRALFGVSGYHAALGILESVHASLVGARCPVEFHAAGTTSTESFTRTAFQGAPAHSMTAVRSTKTCSKRLHVILSENVEGLGKTGEMVLVASGYARNYLVPNRLAKIHVERDRTGKKRYRGLSFAAMKYAQESEGVSSVSGAGVDTPVQSAAGQSLMGSPASLTKDQMMIDQKKDVKRLETIVRKLTENPVVFKGLKTVNGVLEASIGPSEIRIATAKQLGIEIVDALIDMEGDVLDRPGDYLIPLKLEDVRTGLRAKMNVRIGE